MRCDHGCVEGLDLVVAVTNVDAIVEPVDGANRRVQADIPDTFGDETNVFARSPVTVRQVGDPVTLSIPW